jgi:predicted transposase YbfD/YdcC
MFVSLFSQESGLVLHIKRIENKKGSEIDEGQAIIEDCSLQNKVFTGDALHCQKKTISLIAKSKNDYVITVKGNQKNLDQWIQDLSNSSKAESCFLEQDNSHGRKISREAQLFVGWVSGSVTWAAVGFHASTQPTFILYLIPPTHLSRKIEVFKVRKNERQGFENPRIILK